MWKFEVFKDDERGWCWRLVQLNTVIVIESTTSYPRRADARDAALEVRTKIGTADVELL